MTTGDLNPPHKALSQIPERLNMTQNPELNINTFCPLNCYVPTFCDSQGRTAFIVNDGLYQALGLQHGFHHEEYLASSEWERRMPNYASDESDAWQLVSESGFYKLVLLGDTDKAKAFQAWVSGVVLPAIQADGLYMIGEELRFSGPEKLGVNVRELEGRQGAAMTLREQLTSVILPELRLDRMYMSGMTAYLSEGLNTSKLREADLRRIINKKAARGKPGDAMLH